MARETILEYYLWLDESGDFKERHSAPSSLVGGVACDRAVRDRVAPGKLIGRILNNRRFHDAIAADPDCRADARHSTELPRSIRTAARVTMMQACAEAGFEFVIFQNRRRVSVGDTTTNYLNFLAEGIAQYIAHLCASVQKQVHLNVVIGRRVDTALLEQGKKTVIPEERYAALIRERVELAKARCLFDVGRQVGYDISFASDKRNDYLVLSDYVCSCRLSLDRKDEPTRTAFAETLPDGRSMREAAEQAFRKQGVHFELYEDQVRMTMRQHLNSHNYGSALFLYMGQAAPDEMARRELLSRFSALDAETQRVQLSIFFDLVRGFSQMRSLYGALLELLRAFLERLPELSFRQQDLAALCRFNAYLYLATIHNHLGHTQQALVHAQACEQLLPQILQRPENLDLYFILRNRQAVILQDDLRFEDALMFLEDVVAVTELQRDYCRELLALIQHPGEPDVTAEGAKLLGTCAQTYQYALPCRPELYAQAVATAEKAAAAFTTPEDKARQQLTWAEIEAETGHAPAAVEHLCAAFGCGPEALAGTLSASEDVYTWYHIMRIARYLDAHAACAPLAAQLYALFKPHAMAFGDGFPAHAAARHAATYCAGHRELSADRDRFYKRCRELCLDNKDSAGPFKMIGLAATAEQALQCWQLRPPQVQRWLERLRSDLALAGSAPLTPGSRNYVQKWQQQLLHAGADPAAALDVCTQISQRVPY